ncbi:MAG: hypothetical protein E7292_01660 [Lachnospiraceae bacterium]|nr:hypothetical protein [Lachnospiraceae bacterium]
MAESKKKKISAMLLFEIGGMLIATAGICGLVYGGFVKQGMDYMLAHIVFVVLGIGTVGFGIRRGMLTGDLDYDNAEYPKRFWICFLSGLVVSFVYVFLPSAAWPFLPIYILLSLYSNMAIGVLAATTILAVPVCLTDAGLEVFLVYLISGFWGALLFKNIKNGFKTGLPFVLSMAGLLICETAGTVLVINARPGVESFVVPGINMIVSGILVLGILKTFFGKVIYKYRENFLDLNDPENEILGELKQSDKKTYMKSIHTAYFCERIALKLGLHSDSLKCAGYYHVFGQSLEEKTLCFPPEVRLILEEYFSKGKPILHKETAVLIASENIVGTILTLLEQANGGKVDYDKVIDAVFKRYQVAGTFKQCDISMKEFFAMQKIFKEEKLYYDFLR